MTPLDRHPVWKALENHRTELEGRPLRDLFAEDPERGRRFALEACGFYLDYSKNRISAETIRLLVRLAEQAGLRERIDAMFAGERINTTEDRPVLHVALRAPRDAVIEVDGRNVVPDVHAVLDRMAIFAAHVRAGKWKGYTGSRIRNVVNVGIGGSDLGPAMAYQALPAARILPELRSETETELHHDASTNALIRHYRQRRTRRGSLGVASEATVDARSAGPGAPGDPR